MIVVDFLPRASDRLPPSFALHRGTVSKKGDCLKVAQVWHPLGDGPPFDFLAAGAERE